MPLLVQKLGYAVCGFASFSEGVPSDRVDLGNSGSLPHPRIWCEVLGALVGSPSSEAVLAMEQKLFAHYTEYFSRM